MAPTASSARALKAQSAVRALLTKWNVHDLLDSPSVCRGLSVCGKLNCDKCHHRSFASYDAAKVSMWSPQNKQHPSQIPLNKNKIKFCFDCRDCGHTFSSVLKNIVSKGRWCPYCRTSNKKVCGVRECTFCFPNSFACYDSEKVAAWASRNIQQPWQVAKFSRSKVWFDCSNCYHQFESTLAQISQGTWCPYCTSNNSKLCDIEGCFHCHKRSFASYHETEKVQAWSTKNGKKPWQMTLYSNKVVVFDCSKCEHQFSQAVFSVSNGGWCPYCAYSTKLCDIEGCFHCHERSFASYHETEKVQAWSTKNGKKPWQMTLYSNEVVAFDCSKCGHQFNKAVSQVSQGGWCPYCVRQAICGEQQCTFCKAPCVICQLVGILRPGQRQTPDGMMCLACFCISGHAPLSTRAKISLEMHFIMSLELATKNSNVKWGQPSSWDCAVLPCMAFKPDLMYIFNKDGDILQTTGKTGIDKKISNQMDIDHVVILEVLEVGTQQHSDARSVSDYDREVQIRAVFGDIPVFFLYVVVAAFNHRDAHDEDKFFAKGCASDPKDANKYEYMVVECRKEEWDKRIADVVAYLEEANASKINSTHWIGH
jgi:hypothetical protein